MTDFKLISHDDILFAIHDQVHNARLEDHLSCEFANKIVRMRRWLSRLKRTDWPVNISQGLRYGNKVIRPHFAICGQKDQ